MQTLIVTRFWKWPSAIFNIFTKFRHFSSSYRHISAFYQAIFTISIPVLSGVTIRFHLQTYPNQIKREEKLQQMLISMKWILNIYSATFELFFRQIVDSATFFRHKILPPPRFLYRHIWEMWRSNPPHGHYGNTLMLTKCLISTDVTIWKFLNILVVSDLFRDDFKCNFCGLTLAKRKLT